MDPLLCVRRFEEPRQREIVGLVASSLAYGRVENIIRTIDLILCRAGNDLFSFLHGTTFTEKRRIFRDIRHRFNTGDDIALLLQAAAYALDTYGSLEKLFLKNFSSSDVSIFGAAHEFVGELKMLAQKAKSPSGKYFDYLLPSPVQGSACKRLNMYFRWMIRADDGIDCGVWKDIPSSTLIIPVDAHVARVARLLKLTDRKSADWRMAEQITGRLKKVSPEDPVKYDFSLCRYGMMKFREGL